MGTVAEVTVHGSDPAVARRQVEAVFTEIARLEAQLSRWRPESALSRLNAAAGRGPQPVPADLARVLREAVHGRALSRGAFDVTVGPVVALWVEAARSDRIPREADIAAALRSVGAQRIRVDGEGRVELPDPRTSVDLGGIAKGYALDRAAERLRAEGVEAALLQIGQSSTWALGAPPGEAGWRLGLRGASGQVESTVRLRDRAFSVSSSLGQWSVIGGRRFGHVVDPRTGWALERAAQAAVVSGDATTAEILSTALVVLDPQDGMAVVESLGGVEARWLDDAGHRMESSGWAAVTAEEPFLPGPGRP
jgi:thiamine biosynthesis lipoprotein